MSEYAEVDDLLTQTLDEDDVTLASGKKVRVRAMSRGEVFAMQKAFGGDEAAKERRIVSLCTLIPKMSEKQVGDWQRGPAGNDLDAITDKIQELSKLKAGADKSGVSGVRDDAGSGVRVLPSDQAGDDRVRAPEVNE